MEIAGPKDFIWIHDYHLMLVAKYLKEENFASKLSFFLHIPFTPLDIFLKIPWRFEILRALLDFDSIGLQTLRDLRNFVQVVKLLLKDAVFEEKGSSFICKTAETTSKIGAYPISIDFNEFESFSLEPEVIKEAESIRSSLSSRKIVFSLDRLDYTKGITFRLDAIKQFLNDHPEMHRKVNFIQVVVPSRTDIKGYIELKEKIDRQVSEINSQYTYPGWIPIHYMFHPLSHRQLVAFYRASDVALVTPVKDGMNLVCKEYIAANTEETGALILSEFAGAASQLKEDAFLINPYDRNGTAETIYEALTSTPEILKEKMRRLRKKVKDENIYKWLESIIKATGENYIKIGLDAPEEYFPAESNKIN